jgi:hypothetical protein
MATILEPSAGWPISLRRLAALGGLSFTLGALVIGASILANDPTGDRLLTGIALVCLALASIGAYVVVAGYWGGWGPAPQTGARVRSIRASLVIALVTGGYMYFGMPLVALAKLKLADRVNLIALTAMLTIALFGLLAIKLWPRVVAFVLGCASLYVLVVALNFVRLLLEAPVALAPSAPARSVSLLLAGGFAVAMASAFVLALPVRVRAKNQRARTQSANVEVNQPYETRSRSFVIAAPPSLPPAPWQATPAREAVLEAENTQVTEDTEPLIAEWPAGAPYFG